MRELINGRTAEEIKTALRWAAHDCNGMTCGECSFEATCRNCDESAIADDALALIERLEAAQPRWISVEERLPEAYAFCLVAIKDYGYGTTHTDIAAYDGEIWVKDAGSYYDIVDKGKVTYWAKLPEPPKEDEHDAKRAI